MFVMHTALSANAIVILELLATAAFALSGVLGAMRQRMDIVGICACGFLAAFGGGTLDVTPLFRMSLQLE